MVFLYTVYGIWIPEKNVSLNVILIKKVQKVNIYVK